MQGGTADVGVSPRGAAIREELEGHEEETRGEVYPQIAQIFADLECGNLRPSLFLCISICEHLRNLRIYLLPLSAPFLALR
jgi:hypothetical protein